MKTITAKELRDNLDQVVKRVQHGERIQVTYRSKPAFTLVPEGAEEPKVQPGTPEATKLFLERAAALREKARGSYQLPPGKTYTEQYFDDAAKKYGF